MNRAARPIRYFTLLLGLWLAAWTGSALARQEVETRKGIIGTALYTVAKPAKWDGKVLVFAHGLRPASEPLRADLNIERSLYRTLLDDGWIIATTSYRRNGIIIEDAIRDLDLLRRHVIETDGDPKRVIVMGDSMGGLIGTLIAESAQSGFHAVLAAGAAVASDQLGGAVSFTYEPHLPILFLTNRSELHGPAEYAQQAASAAVPPALWRVDRDGHVNVNDQERLAAVRALEEALDGGNLERRRDGTIAIAANSSARFFENSVEGNIAGVTENHGNIFTSLVPEDLEQLGLATGDHFELSVGDHTVRVLLGSDYGDVAKGEWIGILRAEGVLMIARNYASACEALQCSTGDTLTITPAHLAGD